MRRLVLIPVLLAAASPLAAQTPSRSTSATEQAKATATFIDAKGTEVGTAELIEAKDGVLIKMEVRGVPEGEHAFHVHAVGKCDPAGGFNSAGPHFTPGGQRHGVNADGGPHAGDMPNQFANAGDVLRAHVFNPSVTLLDGSSSLFDEDGSALVIHSGVDDYVSQPAGAAGDRLACAVIEKAD